MIIAKEIQGADAERLADCIKFAAKHNLAITEHTQCGLNENSGNVWLWDEDWSACIYQDIGFSGACFSYSCPNCGDEQDCDDLSEVESLNEFSNEHDGCEDCRSDKTEVQ